MTAVKNNGYSIEFASDDLKNNKTRYDFSFSILRILVIKNS
jgi:hypothetical protein